MTSPDLSCLSPYDRAAWDEIQSWKTKKSRRSLVPAGPKVAIARAGKSVADKAMDIPGADTVLGAVQDAVEGAFGTIDRVSIASVRRRAIVRRFDRAGHDVAELDDVRRLDLRTIDRVRPGSICGTCSGLLPRGPPLEQR